MAESTARPSPSPSPDDMNWNLVHFRDNLLAVENDVRDFRKEMADRFAEIRKEFGEICKEIAGIRREIGEVRIEIGEVRKEIGKEIGALRQDTSDRIERSEARTASQFRWTYGLILMSWLSLAGMILPLYFRS